MACCTVVYDDNIEVKVFRNDDNQTCAVKLINYLNELSIETTMNYIDHKTISPDWRFIEDLTIKQKQQVRGWQKIHKEKTRCDICHEFLKEFCKDCKILMRNKAVKFDPCYMCEDATGKCYDHCHLTGKYRSTACWKCNISKINCKAYKLPVLFHNLEGYDGHLMIKSMLEVGDKLSEETINKIESKLHRYSDVCVEIISKIIHSKHSITAIPKSSEKLITSSNGFFESRDSYKLTLASLDIIKYGVNLLHAKYVVLLFLLKKYMHLRTASLDNSLTQLSSLL
jgi:hypothetical protein